MEPTRRAHEAVLPATGLRDFSGVGRQLACMFPEVVSEATAEHLPQIRPRYFVIQYDKTFVIFSGCYV